MPIKAEFFLFRNPVWTVVNESKHQVYSHLLLANQI
jgi:hypothetical protein